jgi:hippurate hydrolase
MNGMPEDRLPEIAVSREATPPTVNDPELAARLRPALAAAFGGETLLEPSPQTGMGAEDFAYFVQPETGVRGAYMSVGGTPQAAFDAQDAGGPPVPSHHSPLFRIDPEPSVTLGTEAMIVAVLELLAPGAETPAD